MTMISTAQKAKHPDDLSATERMLEAAELLATAIMRQKKSRKDKGIRLDITATESVHVTSKAARENLS